MRKRFLPLDWLVPWAKMSGDQRVAMIEALRELKSQFFDEENHIAYCLHLASAPRLLRHRCIEYILTKRHERATSKVGPRMDQGQPIEVRRTQARDIDLGHSPVLGRVESNTPLGRFISGGQTDSPAGRNGEGNPAVLAQELATIFAHREGWLVTRAVYSV